MEGEKLSILTIKTHPPKSRTLSHRVVNTTILTYYYFCIIWIEHLDHGCNLINIHSTIYSSFRNQIIFWFDLFNYGNCCLNFFWFILFASIFARFKISANPMNKGVRLTICLLTDKIKLQNQSRATEGATELKKEEKMNTRTQNSSNIQSVNTNLISII